MLLKKKFNYFFNFIKLKKLTKLLYNNYYILLNLYNYKIINTIFNNKKYYIMTIYFLFSIYFNNSNIFFNIIDTLKNQILNFSIYSILKIKKLKKNIEIFNIVLKTLLLKKYFNICQNNSILFNFNKQTIFLNFLENIKTNFFLILYNVHNKINFNGCRRKKKMAEWLKR